MNRILSLDVIRIVACVMIVMMHAPMPDSGIDGRFLAANGLLTAPGIGLFVMVSGALLLPVNVPTKTFLRRRLSKVLYPTLFWTFFYMGVKLFNGDIHISEAATQMLSIPFSAQFNGVLWFMYMLIGLYLLAPVISPWLEKASQKELRLYLLVWAVTLCYPIVRNVVSVNEGTTGILYYFGGYVGYFVLGYYMRRYACKITILGSVLLIVLPFAIGTICKMRHIDVDYYDLFWYLSIFTAMSSMSWFFILHRKTPSYSNANRSHRVIVQVSNCCFGIYLSHIFMMRTILWKWSFLQQMDGIASFALIVLLTLAGSLLMTYLLSLLPFGDYIIGFKQKK